MLTVFDLFAGFTKNHQLHVSKDQQLCCHLMVVQNPTKSVKRRVVYLLRERLATKICQPLRGFVMMSEDQVDKPPLRFGEGI